MCVCVCGGMVCGGRGEGEREREGGGRRGGREGEESTQASQHTAACSDDVSRLPDLVSKSGQHLNPTGF